MKVQVVVRTKWLNVLNTTNNNNCYLFDKMQHNGLGQF